MFLTTHAAAGILLGHYVENPLAVFGLSFASHFVLDFIPHGDEELYHDQEWKVERRYKRAVLINVVDVAALIGLIIWVLVHPDYPHGRLMIVGILGGLLPDLLSHFFPIIHQKFSWLFLVRWLYSLSKPTGLRYVIRVQNWFHRVLHHDLVRRDIPFRVGLTIQVVIVGVCLWLAG